MCESREGRPGLPVPNSPYGLKKGRKGTLEEHYRDVFSSRWCLIVLGPSVSENSWKGNDSQLSDKTGDEKRGGRVLSTCADWPTASFTQSSAAYYTLNGCWLDETERRSCVKVEMEVLDSRPL